MAIAKGERFIWLRRQGGGEVMADDIFNFHIDFEALSNDVDAVCHNFDLYDEKSVQATTQAMVENTEDLLSKSMRIVPHDEGILEGSGSARVQNVEVAKASPEGPAETHTLEIKDTIPAVRPGSVITGQVSYNTPYAAIQHEELSYEHKPGRQAKYLETPLKAMFKRYTKNIADMVKAVRR
jgi:hypothetical protein